MLFLGMPQTCHFSNACVVYFLDFWVLWIRLLSGCICHAAFSSSIHCNHIGIILPVLRQEMNKSVTKDKFASLSLEMILALFPQEVGLCFREGLGLSWGCNILIRIRGWRRGKGVHQTGGKCCRAETGLSDLNNEKNWAQDYKLWRWNKWEVWIDSRSWQYFVAHCNLRTQGFTSTTCWK